MDVHLGRGESIDVGIDRIGRVHGRGAGQEGGVHLRLDGTDDPAGGIQREPDHPVMDANR